MAAALPPTIRIHRATVADARAIADVLTDGFDSGGWLELLLRPLTRYFFYDDARNRLNSQSSDAYAYWLARRDRPTASLHETSVPVATVELSLRPFGSWNRDPWCWQASHPKSPYITNLTVIERARRRGIATHLLEHCERTALRWGYDRIYLHVLAHNEGALALYRKCGYRPQKKNRGHWWIRADLVLMCKVLAR